MMLELDIFNIQWPFNIDTKDFVYKKLILQNVMWRFFDLLIRTTSHFYLLNWPRSPVVTIASWKILFLLVFFYSILVLKGGFCSSFIKKNAYSDFLKKPNFFPHIIKNYSGYETKFKISATFGFIYCLVWFGSLSGIK